MSQMVSPLTRQLVEVDVIELLHALPGVSTPVVVSVSIAGVSLAKPQGRCCLARHHLGHE
jgi:hypothetical protein